MSEETLRAGSSVAGVRRAHGPAVLQLGCLRSACHRPALLRPSGCISDVRLIDIEIRCSDDPRQSTPRRMPSSTILVPSISSFSIASALIGHRRSTVLPAAALVGVAAWEAFRRLSARSRSTICWSLSTFSASKHVYQFQWRRDQKDPHAAGPDKVSQGVCAKTMLSSGRLLLQAAACLRPRRINPHNMSCCGKCVISRVYPVHRQAMSTEPRHTTGVAT